MNAFRSLASPLVLVLASTCAFGLQAGATKADPKADAKADSKSEAAKLTAPDIAAIADKLAPGLVRVEYTPQFDSKGEAPPSDRYSFSRARPGSDIPGLDATENWDGLIKEERPGESGGYLISPTTVFTADPRLHPRFIKSIVVRRGDATATAKPKAYLRDHSGWFLELDKPLAGATPLQFDPLKSGPFFSLVYTESGGQWFAAIAGQESTVVVTDDHRKLVQSTPGSLIVTRTGEPVTITPGRSRTADDAWKLAPDAMPALSEADMTKALAALEQSTKDSLLRVQLNFRSPRSGSEMGGGRRGRFGYDGGEDGPALTEWNGLGVVTGDKTVLVLADLKPKVTGRLERVRVFKADGTPVTATFSGSLKDWGAMLVTAESSVGTPVNLSTKSITDHRDVLLLKAELSIRGETRTAYFSRERIEAFSKRYRGDLYPIASTGQTGGDEGGRSVIFDLDGTLVSLPMSRREKVTTRERWGEEGLLQVPAAILQSALTDRAKSIDTENRPLTEAEENRLAWLGVEMQAMDPELARAQNIVEPTRNGEVGGIVTFVYESSPASQAGIKVGDVLLRLHIEGQPKPLDVNVDENPMGNMMDQFWAMIDRVPEEYLDRLPKPWGNVENTLARALTDVGFGTPFTADLLRDGKTMTVDFKVAQGPAHYDSAARFKSADAVGLSVRDLTYEVRRYFQVKPEEPGVIIAKVERGSRAAVAGLKPYEIIRSINDQPIKNVQDFEEALKQGGELRLAVKRMTQGRTVKLKVDAADGKPADKGSGKSEPGAGVLQDNNAPAPATSAP